MDRRQKHPVDTTIAGINIRWTTDCMAEEEDLRSIFRYHLCNRKDNNLHVHHHAEFVESESLPPVPADATLQWEGPYVVLGNTAAAIRWYRSAKEGTDLIVLSDEICILHTRADARATCFLACRNENGRSIRPKIWDAFIVMIHTILSLHGRYSVHSAAVGIGNRAMLFLGESGSGKSTLTTDLCARGADFLGDDLTFLYLDEKGQVNVGSLLFDAKLITSRWSGEKKHVDVGASTGCATPLALPLGHIFLVRQTKGKESFATPADPMDCMTMLINSSNNVRMQWDSDRWYDTLSAAAESHRYFTFHFGNRRLLDKDIFTHV